MRDEFTAREREPEVELFPRRWLVRNNQGQIRVEAWKVVDCDNRLMGTDESPEHAAKRIGWAE